MSRSAPRLGRRVWLLATPVSGLLSDRFGPCMIVSLSLAMTAGAALGFASVSALGRSLLCAAVAGAGLGAAAGGGLLDIRVLATFERAFVAAAGGFRVALMCVFRRDRNEARFTSMWL